MAFFCHIFRHIGSGGADYDNGGGERGVAASVGARDGGGAVGG